jgi:hypothetical protein
VSARRVFRAQKMRHESTNVRSLAGVPAGR